MDRVTAYRTFGDPSYSPTRRTRIRNDRFYLVTLQNVETDARTDYVGLGEGTYTELVGGAKAREYRDARLNHCNRVEEYAGPVWEWAVDWWRSPGSRYVRSLEEARDLTRHYEAQYQEHRAQLARERARYLAKPQDDFTRKVIADIEKAEAQPQPAPRVRKVC